ncbi:MAG TPA: Gfo/Idh/MocA family oxidoreductase, partial [Thermodesulfobacteriota bacterium]
MNRDVRVAMLGTGFIAGFRTQVYRRLEGVEVVSVLGRDPERTRKFAQANSIGFPATSFDELLKGPEFEAVDLCLPNHLHLEAAVQAARTGKHILCEKPLGRTAEEARAMLEAAEAAKVIHCYGENLLFTPDMQEILSVIEKGIIGSPLWMRGREGHFGPHSSWFYEHRYSGGGALLDMGCHVIGAFNFITKQKAKA